MEWSQRRSLSYTLLPSGTTIGSPIYQSRNIPGSSSVAHPGHLEHVSNRQIHSVGEFLTELLPLDSDIFPGQPSQHSNSLIVSSWPNPPVSHGTNSNDLRWSPTLLFLLFSTTWRMETTPAVIVRAGGHSAQMNTAKRHERQAKLEHNDSTTPLFRPTIDRLDSLLRLI